MGDQAFARAWRADERCVTNAGWEHTKVCDEVEAGM